MALAWYVATTYPMKELTAEENLTQQGFTAFNPKCLIPVRIRGRRQFHERPYIPGYLFIHFDIDDDRWRKVAYTRGIKSMLYAASEKPAPVNGDAMKVLLDNCNGQYVKAFDLDLALSKIVWVGAKVRVPALGQDGRVTWTNGDRLKVLLHVFGSAREIKTTADAVELVA